VAALGLLIFTFLYSPILDQDIWWHLKGGWYILTRGAVPRTNTFSYTSAARWIDLHWLFQVLVYKAYDLLGPGGVIALKVLVGGAGWAILARAAASPRRFLPLLPFLAVGAVASNERMTDRPELFTYLFLALQLALLLRWRRRPSAGPLLSIVAIQVLWSNLHALSVLGVALVSAFVAGETATRLLAGRLRAPDRDAPMSSADLKKLVLTTLGCVAALSATPYGVQGAIFPFTLLHQLHNQNIAIAEFMSPFSAFHPTTAILAFRILQAATIGVLLLALPRIDLSLFFAAAGMFVLAASARRNIPVFVFTVLPLIGAHLGVAANRLRLASLPPVVGGALRILCAGVTVAALLVLTRDVVSGRFYARDQLVKRFGAGIEEGVIIREAMDYVMANRLRGNAFNDIDSGGYFIWRAYPERKAFIDPRLEAVPQASLDAYSRAFYTNAGWRALDAAYRFEYVVLNHTVGVNWRLIERLRADPAWALVQVDPVGLVYVRRKGAPAGLVERDEIAAGRRGPPPWAEEAIPADPLAGAVRALLRVEAIPSTRNAFTYSNLLIRLGYLREASVPLEWALARDPASAYGQLLRGSVADALGDLPRARAAFEEASRLDPRSMEAAFNLGFARLRSGELAGAMSDLERAIRLRPTFAQAHAMLGVARLAAGNAAGAEAPLRRAIELDPALVDPVYYLGVMARQRGDLAAATGLFADFLKRPGGNPALRADAARTLRNAR